MVVCFQKDPVSLRKQIQSNWTFLPKTGGMPPVPSCTILLELTRVSCSYQEVLSLTDSTRAKRIEMQPDIRSSVQEERAGAEQPVETQAGCGTGAWLRQEVFQRGRGTSLTTGLGSLECAVGHEAVDSSDNSKPRQTGFLCPLQTSEEALCMERTVPEASETMRDLHRVIEQT